MWSKVFIVVLLCWIGVKCEIKRDKRTIGILFRGLVDAVTGPAASLTYPQEGTDRRTTPKPDSRPQTQIFIVPIPEKQRLPPMRPPAPLKPADLAEIHIHPQLVKQLEALARAQAIRGKMIAKRFPVNDSLDDNVKAGDNSEASKDSPTAATILPTKPSKYFIKILPEDNDEKGAVSITIVSGKDGKLKIMPSTGKEKVRINVEMGGFSKEVKSEKENSPNNPNDEVEILDKPKKPYEFVPPGGSGPLGPGYPPYQEQYPPYQPGYSPQNPYPPGYYPAYHPNTLIPERDPGYQSLPPPPPPPSYADISPYHDILSFLGLADSPQPAPPTPLRAPPHREPMAIIKEHNVSNQHVSQNAQHGHTPVQHGHNIPPPHGFPHEGFNQNQQVNNIPSHPGFPQEGFNQNQQVNNIPSHPGFPQEGFNQNQQVHNIPSHPGFPNEGFNQIHQGLNNPPGFPQQGSTQGYPQLPPLPGNLGSINQVNFPTAQFHPVPHNNFPVESNEIFPFGHPGQQVFQQSPSTHVQHHSLVFPHHPGLSHSYRFPPNYPLARSDKKKCSDKEKDKKC